MANKTCDFCGKAFYVRNSSKRFCSSLCKAKATFKNKLYEILSIVKSGSDGKSTKYLFKCKKCGNEFGSFRNTKKEQGIQPICDCYKKEHKPLINEFVKEISHYASATKSKSGQTEYIFKCLWCGREFVSYKNKNYRNGINHVCECQRIRNHKVTASTAWKRLKDVRRNITGETALFDALISDKFDGLATCVNCLHFDTEVCKVTDVEWGTIDAIDHKCDKFDWWKKQEGK